MRWRITLAFVATSAVGLFVVGAFLYARFGSELRNAQDDALRTRAAEIAATAGTIPPANASGVEADERVAQVLRPDGSVVVATTGAQRSLLTARQLDRATRGELLFDRRGDTLVDESLRMLAMPAGGRVVVVGASRDEIGETLATLLGAEALGFLAALALAGAAGHLVAGRLARAHAAEGAALDRQRRFVADASHELRTPLTILRGEIDVALAEGGDAEALRAALRSAGDEARRLSALAADLLVLAGSDEGGLPLHHEDVAIATLLHADDVVADVPAGLVVRADRERLRQALENLVDNARRHGRGTIRLAAAVDGPDVVLSVSDEGAGLPPEFADRAFERFTRPDAGRSGGGAGLGLAIVRAIAEAHGGSAGAGPGATFWVRLPHRTLIDPVAR